MNAVRIFVLIVVLTCADGGICIAEKPVAAPPERVPVEPQPLIANVSRLIKTLTMLGSPLSESVSKSLHEMIEMGDADRLQQELDREVLFVVAINPEERVKVQRGPAEVALQQYGFTPVIIKILNGSTSTGRLRMVSPQAGAVYAGVTKLSMQRQQSLELIENENVKRHKDRFLAIEMFDQPPLANRLSGLEVEYALGLILSTESGKREATIGFDLGQGEQDLGFRGETAVLFQVRPAVPVKVSIRDEKGVPTTASLIIRDQQGRIYPPQAKRLAPDFFFQPQIYRADGETILLPPGDFRIQSGRGPEYWTREQTFHVSEPAAPSNPSSLAPPTDGPLEIRLQRWVNPEEYGFYSGDHHIHAAGCAHYTSPTEGVLPEDMFRQVKGEGLNVGCILTWGPCFAHQRQFFEPRPNDISDATTILKYDLEISGFGSQSLGHVCLLNLQDQTYPGSEGTMTKGWPTWTTPVMRWAKQQGGITGYAHSASGLAIDPAAASKRLLSRYDRDQNQMLSPEETELALLPEPWERIDANDDHQLDLLELRSCHDRVADQLPNLAIPEMNGVGAMEICVTAAEGVCDFISAMDTRRIQEWNTWYHLLNCGFPMKVSGETDFPCMSSRRVGQGRVYVQLHHPSSAADQPRKIDFAAWCQGLAKGESYVSDGFAHALAFAVNGVTPGHDLRLDQPGAVKVTAQVSFAPETPISIAQGTDSPAGGKRLVGDTVELHGPRADRIDQGGDRTIEIVLNGHPVAQQIVPADGKVHRLEMELTIPRSGWIALRQFPQLHTNPVNVIVADRPIRASRASAQWCEQTIELLWTNRAKNIALAEREEARQTFERAKTRFREIAAESEAER